MKRGGGGRALTRLLTGGSLRKRRATRQAERAARAAAEADARLKEEHAAALAIQRRHHAQQQPLPAEPRVEEANLTRLQSQSLPEAQSQSQTRGEAVITARSESQSVAPTETHFRTTDGTQSHQQSDTQTQPAASMATASPGSSALATQRQQVSDVALRSDDLIDNAVDSPAAVATMCTPLSTQVLQQEARELDSAAMMSQFSPLATPPRLQTVASSRALAPAPLVGDGFQLLIDDLGRPFAYNAERNVARTVAELAQWPRLLGPLELSGRTPRADGGKTLSLKYRELDAQGLVRRHEYLPGILPGCMDRQHR